MIFTLNREKASKILRTLSVGNFSAESQLLIRALSVEVDIREGQSEVARKRLGDISREVKNLDDPFLTASINRIKGLFFDKTLEHDSAQVYLRWALDGFSSPKLSCQRCLLKANYNLATHYRGLYDNKPAKTYYNFALKIAEDSPDRNLLIQSECHFQLAAIYQEEGDVEKATTHILKAIAIGKQVPLKRLVQNSYVVYGNILYTAQKYLGAIEHYQLAIKGIIDLEGPESKLLIGYYANCGYFYTLINELDKSFGMLYDAKYLAQKLSGESSLDASMVFFNLSEAHMEKRQLDSAKYYLQKNIDIKKTIYGSAHQEIGWAYNGMASMFGKLNMYDSALYYSQKALIANSSTFDQPDLAANPAITHQIDYSLFHMLYGKEKYLVAKWKKDREPWSLESAIRLYDQLDTLVFWQRSNFSTDISRLYLMEDVKGVFEMGLDLYSELFLADTSNALNMEKFYTILQKSKAVQLMEEISQSERVKDDIIPARYHDESQKLKAQLAKLEIGSSAMTVSDSIVDLRMKLTSKMDSLKREVSNKYPAFYEYKMRESFMSIDRLNEFLDERKALFVEYYWGNSNIYAFTFDGQNFTITKTSDLEEIGEHLNNVLEILSNRQDAPRQYMESASYLSEKLLGKQLLKQAGKYNRLCIIPDGKLLFLPFEALVVDGTNSSDFSRLNYLIKSTNVVYNFNSALLGKDLRAMDISKVRLLALGADDQAAPDRALPGARKELDGIKPLMPGEFIYNAEKDDLLEGLDKYDIIHIALHGQADLYNFYGSHLRFVGHGPTESKLHPYELFDRKVTADLVVLSACESGLGKSVAGEGIMGMGRAFKYAGASSIIQSGWRVDDDATQKIMSSFYSDLKEKDVGYENALHYAKLQFIESGDSKTAHPGRWAAMFYYGDIDTETSFWYTSLIKTFLAAIALTTSIFLLSRMLFRSRTLPHS